MRRHATSTQYTIKNYPTWYKDNLFRSRLEARWAAFFDLAGWVWQYEPLDLPGLSPDFRVVIPCAHSECRGEHVLLVEVKPYFNINQFTGHPCMEYPYGEKRQEDQGKVVAYIPADSSAAFGASPDVTLWEMTHGAGGGMDSVVGWVHNASRLWGEAGSLVQFIKRKQ